ncbi:MAG: hypothetical protein JJ974_05245 [Phycisphaerales bacterium]|nr:hypothetical protein [Phycisphaerales bacterium]
MRCTPFIILALTASVAFAEPPQQPERDSDPATLIKEKSKHIDLADPDSLRKRLTRTLNFAQRIVEKHEEALAQLDAGVDPREIMRSLRTPDTRKSFTDQRSKRKPEDRADRADRAPTQEGDLVLSSNGMDDHAHANHPPHPNSPISADDLARVRDFIERELPEVHSKLVQVESLSPPAAEQLVSLLARKALEILTLQKTDPTLSDLKLRELKAGLNYTEASRDYRMLLRQSANDPTELAQAEDRVRQAASDRFDAQVQIKQYEIHRLTMRVQELHSALDELNNEREQQVNAQVESAKSFSNRRGKGRSGNQIDH